MWEAWLREAEGKVLLPCTEGSSCDMREEEMQAALEACKLERSIHHSTIKRQHMFRVGSKRPMACTARLLEALITLPDKRLCLGHKQHIKADFSSQQSECHGGPLHAWLWSARPAGE